MPYDPQTAAPEPGVLPYATPNQPVEELRPPAWLRPAVVLVSLFILTLFLLGLPPLAGALDYTRDIPIGEVIEYAWATGIRGSLDSAGMVGVALFAPAAVVGLVTFLYLRGITPQRTALAANVLLPALWLMHFWPVFMVAGPPTLVAAVSGKCDGEVWSEGFVCYSAIASWSTLWLAVAAVLLLVRRQRARKPAVGQAA